MKKERVIIIGDVHGCFKELQALLKKCDFQSKRDRLIFVGDLINKGPFSLKVLDFVIEGNFECTLGNHEWGFLRSLEDKRYFKNGNKALAEEMGKDLGHYATWMKELPLYIEDEDFIVIHGGIEPGVSLKNQRAEVSTRIRTWDGVGTDLNNPDNPSWFELYKLEKLVIFGHWAAKGLIKRANAIGLDTGCVWGGELSALILPQREVQSVEALKEYKSPL